MRLPCLAILVVAVACGGRRPAASATCPPVTAAGPTIPAVPPGPAPDPAPPALDDAAVVAMSRAFLDAFDRRDLAALEAAVGPSFALFEDGRTFDAARLSAGMKARAERKAPMITRTWKDAQVRRSPGAMVFIGLAVEHIPGAPGQPGGELEAWNALVWTPVDGAWKVAHWQWTRGGLEAERAMWNDIYRTGITPFRREPNRLLVETVATRATKGARALDLLSGQGRNALYLASQGYQVTAVDISDEGLRRAREAAAARKLPVTTVNADIDGWELGIDRWDVVTMIYAGADRTLIARIKPSVKRGGRVIVEFFHRNTTKGSGVGGFDTGELAAAFAGWTIERDEVVEDTADWGLRTAKLVRFVARRP